MKINQLSFLMPIVFFASVISCKNTKDNNSETIKNGDLQTSQNPGNTVESEKPREVGFDIKTIAISNEDLGDFPYFKLPDGYEFTDPDHSSSGDSKGLTVNYDKEYFLNDGIYIPQEGKTFKGHISLDRNAKDKTYSPLELQKSFDDLIIKMGGVKINNGKGYKSGEKDRIYELDPQAQPNGYLSSSSYFDNIHTYVIRKADYSVWVQYNMNNETGYITVLKTKAFETK